jgi:hypothetical protein
LRAVERSPPARGRRRFPLFPEDFTQAHVAAGVKMMPMLVIRDAQMKVFQQERERRFVAWVVKQVRQHDGTLIADWPADALDRRVRVAIERAARFDIRDPWSIVEFFVAMAMHGPLFDTLSSVEKVLTDSALPPDARIHAAWRKVPRDVWERSSRLPVPAWW